MNWLHDIANELPAKRDDEPSSLRQDIADELADHLQSSFVRELHRTPEESSAKQHVLDRFGDPRRVARQLWFDAMKEKIMSQRLMLTALVVTAVACLGSTGLSWMLVQQSREANQALLEQAKEARLLNRELLTQNETANSKMLDRLGALAAPGPAAPAKSMEWNLVKIRLVKDQAGGHPAEGYEVSLEGHVLDTANKNTIARKTGADGLADLGVVRPGQHVLKITTPWNESRQIWPVTVLPGQPLTAEFVCPAADRDEVPVSFSVDWPDGLRGRGLWAVCLSFQGDRKIDGQDWAQPWGAKHRLLILNSENELLTLPGDFNYSSPQGPFQFMNEPPSEYPGLYFDSQAAQAFEWAATGRTSSATVPLAKRPFRPYHFQFPNAPAKPDENLPVGRYTLRDILVAEGPAEDTSPGWRKINVLGGMMNNGGGGLPFAGGQNQAGQGQRPSPHPFDNWPRDRRTAQIPESEILTLEVEPGKPNQIKIPIPPKLTEMVRKFWEESK